MKFAEAKVLDLSDMIGGTSTLMLERFNGERLSALLTVEQVIYLRARLEAICDKLEAREEPMS